MFRVWQGSASILVGMVPNPAIAAADGEEEAGDQQEEDAAEDLADVRRARAATLKKKTVLTP